MPVSSISGKHLIDRAVQRVAESIKERMVGVLDIGVGSGTYFDRYSNTLLNNRKKALWTGVEIWEPYIAKYGLANKYAEINRADAREFAATWAERSQRKGIPFFDICFVGDVAEHMTKEEAQAMVGNLLKFCSLVIMSIPLGHYPQGPYDDNPYEEHVKDDWSHQEVMGSFPAIVDFGVENEIGVYFMSGLCFEEMKVLLKPKIAVYAICKNEQRFAPRFAASVNPADYVVICDTGSTDDTPEILQTQIENSRVWDIQVSPWRFDDARNAALMLVPQDADLCVSLDLDEVLPERWYELLCSEVIFHHQTRGKLFDKYNCRFQTVWDWETCGDGASTNTSSHWHERIHTRHNYKWRLPVHEVLTYTGNQPDQMAWLGGLTMTQLPAQGVGLHTYLPLIELSLKEDPRVWKSWFFYADELRKVGRTYDAIEALKKAEALPDCDKSYVCKMLGDYYLAVTDAGQAMFYLQKACALNPTSRECWVRLAEFYSAERMESMAVKAIKEARECITPSSGYDYDPWCWGPRFEAMYDTLVNTNNGE